MRIGSNSSAPNWEKGPLRALWIRTALPIWPTAYSLHNTVHASQPTIQRTWHTAHSQQHTPLGTWHSSWLGTALLTATAHGTQSSKSGRARMMQQSKGHGQQHPAKDGSACALALGRACMGCLKRERLRMCGRPLGSRAQRHLLYRSTNRESGWIFKALTQTCDSRGVLRRSYRHVRAEGLSRRSHRHAGRGAGARGTGPRFAAPHSPCCCCGYTFPHPHPTHTPLAPLRCQSRLRPPPVAHAHPQGWAASSCIGPLVLTGLACRGSKCKGGRGGVGVGGGQ